MSDGMYGPMSPESTFGQGARSAVDEMNQMLRLEQARRASAFMEALADQWRHSPRIPSWRNRNPGRVNWKYFSLPPSDAAKSMPGLRPGVIESMPMPEEYRALIRPERLEDITEDYNVREYLIDAIMNSMLPGRPDRPPELLPQPTRENMYGKFPGR